MCFFDGFHEVSQNGFREFLSPRKRNKKERQHLHIGELHLFGPRKFCCRTCWKLRIAAGRQILPDTKKRKMSNLRRLVEKLVLIFPASSRRQDEDVRTSPQPVIATHSRVSPVRLLAPLAVLPTKLRKAVEHSLFGRRALFSDTPLPTFGQRTSVKI